MSVHRQKKVPGYSEETFAHVFNQPPPYKDDFESGHLTREQFDKFFNEGFVVIDQLFSGDEMEVLEACKKDLEDEVEKLAQSLYRGGKIKELYSNYGLFERLIMLEKEFPGANVILHRLSRLPKNFRKLMVHPKLLNISEQLLGTPDILGNANWNLRCKTPQNDASTVPWHQDNGYVDNILYGQMVITGWIPFLDTHKNNGCMQLARYCHKKGRVAEHKCCWKDTWYIILEEEEMAKTLGVDLEKDIITCPVPYGGVLLFNNMIPHRSLNNFSDKVRWSVDLRWQSSEVVEGFFGLKKGIPLRSSTDPNMKIDWDEFDSVDRQQKAKDLYDIVYDEYDTTIQGPWMAKWEMVHTNKHTEAFVKHEEKATVGTINRQ